MEMKRAVILTGGRIEESFCLEYLEKQPFDFYIAVDSGLQFFYKNHLNPDLIVGDFDSVSGEALHYFEKQKEVKWLRLIPEKDDTDTECAVRQAVLQGYGQIHILGGTGSRLDHMMATVGLLGMALEENVEILLLDSHNRARMIDHKLVITKKEQYGNYVSLLPVTPKVTGVTLKGMKYPLSDYTMVSYKSLGVSNEIVEDAAEIYLKDGALLVVESKD